MKSRKTLYVLLGSVLLIAVILSAAGYLIHSLPTVETEEEVSNEEEPGRKRKKPTLGTLEDEEVEVGIEPYTFSKAKKQSVGKVQDVNQGEVSEGYHSIDEVYPYLKTTGRTVLTDAGLCLDWSNASFTMRGNFDGEVKMQMRFIGGSSQIYGYLYVYVDGNEESPRIIKANNGVSWYTLANVSKGYHTIQVVKINEAQFGVMDVIAFDFMGTLQEKAEKSAIQMEFIGDSITCGADMIESAINTVDAQNGQKTYAALTAKALNADASFISAAGYRLCYCDDGNTKMVLPNIYGKASGIRENANMGNNGDWDFASNKTDVVVINLGTNDTVLVNKGRGEEITSAALSFLKVVREKNPNAIIVWCYGAMTDVGSAEIQAAINTFGDAKTYFLDVTQNNNGLASHPNEEGHQIIANELIAFLKSKLG